jgi:dipeptidyl aminopeptidase/acylaminoacyl peptidase
MAKALKDSNKTVEIVELKGEDHWLSTGATRTEMLARSIAFIDKHIGPNSGAAN